MAEGLTVKVEPFGPAATTDSPKLDDERRGIERHELSPARLKDDPHSSLRAGLALIAGREFEHEGAGMAAAPVEAPSVWDDVERAGSEQPGMVEGAFPVTAI